MSSIAIITARGGSKRIPRKNIKPFRGVPIIAYTIDAALKSNLFEEVMVSTDDLEIKEVAEEYGAKVPFYRSAETSNDHAGTPEVIAEVIESYAAMNRHFDYICVIFPTSAFLTADILQNSYDLLKEGKFDSVFPVLRYSHPIDRAFRRAESGKVEMRWPENMSLRTQDIEPSFHDAGQFYWLRKDLFMKNQDLFTENTGALELGEMDGHDIDNPEDWKVAEFKHQYQYPVNPLAKD